MGGIITATIAGVLTYFFNLTTARRNRTVDLLLKFPLDKDFLDLESIYLHARNEGTLDRVPEVLMNIVTVTDEERAQAAQILNYLSYLESTLAGIAAHTYDEKLYASMYAPKIIKRYNESKVLITKFQGFETPPEPPFPQVGSAFFFIAYYGHKWSLMSAHELPYFAWPVKPNDKPIRDRVRFKYEGLTGQANISASLTPFVPPYPLEPNVELEEQSNQFYIHNEIFKYLSEID